MNRWLKYTLIGLGFGILDWYYLDLLAHFSWGPLGNSILVIPFILLLNYGIWLVPVIPVTWVEARRGKGALIPALAGVLTWSCAIFSYYAYYTVLLSLGVLPNLQHLGLLGERYPGFWQDWLAMFQRIIANQFLEWIPIAMIGGGITGALVYQLRQYWSRRKKYHPQVASNARH